MRRAKRIRYALGAGALSIGVGLAVADVWIFRGSTQSASASLWQLLLADRWTLGFARLALLVACAYAISSVPVLIASGRWITSIGPSGVTAGEAAHTAGEVAVLKAELARKDRALEEAVSVAKRLTDLLDGGSLG